MVKGAVLTYWENKEPRYQSDFEVQVRAADWKKCPVSLPDVNSSLEISGISHSQDLSHLVKRTTDVSKTMLAKWLHLYQYNRFSLYNQLQYTLYLFCVNKPLQIQYVTQQKQNENSKRNIIYTSKLCSVHVACLLAGKSPPIQSKSHLGFRVREVCQPGNTAPSSCWTRKTSNVLLKLRCLISYCSMF